jgi:DNA-binding HxlR family transcriptional regulator
MTTEQRELFRMAILRVLDANNTRFGLGRSAIGHNMVVFGFPQPRTDDLTSELRYLEDKGFVSEALKGISPENRAWRITASGRDFIAQQTAE